MGVATYTDLKTRTTTLLARADLAASVADWVDEAEREIVSRLRVREMEKIAPALTATDGALDVPSDFLSVGELRLASDLETELDYAPSKMLFRYENVSFGTGVGFWDVIGTKIVIRPKPADGEEYWLKYFFQPAALAEGTQETNEIFPAYSDLYLAGTAWRAFDHVRNTEQADRYLNALLGKIETYNAMWTAQKQGSGALRMTPPMVC